MSMKSSKDLSGEDSRPASTQDLFSGMSIHIFSRVSAINNAYEF